mgnify:CR=1 FL=1
MKLTKKQRITFEAERRTAIDMLSFAECQERKNSDNPAALAEAKRYTARVSAEINRLNAILTN